MVVAESGGHAAASRAPAASARLRECKGVGRGDQPQMAAPAATTAGAGGAFTPRDYIAASADAALAKTLRDFRADPKNAEALAGYPATSEERVLFADTIIKINRYGSRQPRTLIITSIAVLNFKPKKYGAFQRRVPIAFVEALWLVRGTNDVGEWAWARAALCGLWRGSGLPPTPTALAHSLAAAAARPPAVTHMWDLSHEYDYRFDAGSPAKRAEIVAALQYAYRALLDKDLPALDLEEKDVKSGLITKPQLKSRALDAGTVSLAMATRRTTITALPPAAGCWSRGGPPSSIEHGMRPPTSGRASERTLLATTQQSVKVEHRGRRRSSLFHNLHDVLVLQDVILADTLRLVLDAAGGRVGGRTVITRRSAGRPARAAYAPPYSRSPPHPRVLELLHDALVDTIAEGLNGAILLPQHHGSRVVWHLALRLGVDAEAARVLPDLLQQLVKVPAVMRRHGHVVWHAV